MGERVIEGRQDEAEQAVAGTFGVGLSSALDLKESDTIDVDAEKKRRKQRYGRGEFL